MRQTETTNDSPISLEKPISLKDWKKKRVIIDRDPVSGGYVIEYNKYPRILGIDYCDEVREIMDRGNQSEEHTTNCISCRCMELEFDGTVNRTISMSSMSREEAERNIRRMILMTNHPVMYHDFDFRQQFLSTVTRYPSLVRLFRVGMAINEGVELRYDREFVRRWQRLAELDQFPFPLDIDTSYQ